MAVAFLTSFMMISCGKSAETNYNVYDSLPSPTKSSGADFKSTGLMSLSATATDSGTIGSSAVSDYNTYAERDNRSGWSFGLDRAAIEAKLGMGKADYYDNNIQQFVRGILSHQSVKDKLASAVNSYPLFKGKTDISALVSADNATLESISVADGITMPDSSLRSAVTLNVLIPVNTGISGVNSLSACSNVISEIRSDSTQADFVSPTAASWNYVIKASLVFFIADRSSLHTAALTASSGDTVTTAETEAVADDFGLITWFLENMNTANIPSYDAVFTFLPSDRLTDGTLGYIHGQAKTDEDTSCLMAVDAMMPEASVIIPGITGSSYLEQDYEYYTHKYSEDLDLLTAGAEYGAACMYDQDGNIVTVDGNSSCSTATGTYDLSIKGRSKTGKAIYGVITPYQKLTGTSAKVAAPDGLDAYREIQARGAICNNYPWNKLKTGRFGRGIILSVTEWAIYGQVADYWNIHWYQRPGSAAAQSAISDAAWLFKQVAQLYVEDGSWYGFAFASAGLAYKYASKFNISVAGHKMGGGATSGIGDFIVDIIRFASLSSGVKTYLEKIGISETTDAMAQILQTQVTGWQDYYSGSYRVCGFKFH